MVKGERYIDDDNRPLIEIARWLSYADLAETLAHYDRFLGAKPRMQDIALFGCLDRFFLCVCLLGRRDLVHPWLYDRCREVEAEPDGYLDLWAREHGKSSLGVIQEVLIDPELTVAIFSSTQKSARKFLHQIKLEFEANQILREAYADVIWDRPKQDAPRWGLDGIVLRRASNPKEATIEAWCAPSSKASCRRNSFLMAWTGLGEIIGALIARPPFQRNLSPSGSAGLCWLARDRALPSMLHDRQDR
jgi:hypothetical protein